MRKYKKPLNRSISIGCISLILSLCLGLSIVNCRRHFHIQYLQNSFTPCTFEYNSYYHNWIFELADAENKITKLKN